MGALSCRCHRMSAPCLGRSVNPAVTRRSLQSCVHVNDCYRRSHPGRPDTWRGRGRRVHPVRVRGAAPPVGFSTVWSDDFDGAAGSPVNGSNWLYDLGHGYSGGAANWGTGEVESMTNSTTTSISTVADTWRSSPSRTVRATGRPAGSRPSAPISAAGRRCHAHRGVRPAANVDTGNGLGYWPAFWALGAPAGRRPRRTGPASASWTSWRTSTVVARNSRPCTAEPLPAGRATRPPASVPANAPAAAARLVSTPTPSNSITAPTRSSCAITLTATTSSRSTLPRSTPPRGTTPPSTVFFVILNLAIGGSFPAAFGGGPTDATVSGQPMLVDYVSVSTKGP